MDWGKIWNDIVNFFKNNVWNIVLFFAVLFVGLIVIKLFINILRRILNKTKMEKIAVGFIVGAVKLILYLILVLSLLSIIGIEITGIITAVSALFLSVGLALQNNIANVANGILIVSTKMFKKGDYIKVDGLGVEGSITQINFLYTTLQTPDNKRITVPNSSIVNNAVIDFDSNLTRRVDLYFTVSYDSDVEKVKEIILACINSNGNVLLDPAPFCRLYAMKDSSLEFVARCWCDREDYWSVHFDVMESVFNEFKRNNVSIPFNQLEIRERTDSPNIPVIGSGLPERVEKVRENKHHIDLENASLSEILTVNKKRYSKKKSKKDKKEKDKSEVKDNVENKTIETVTEDQQNQEEIVYTKNKKDDKNN